PVTGLVVQPDGKVVCVGDFTSYDGTGRNRIARLDSDGTLDASFNPGTGANFLVTSVALQSDGKLLIGGYFNDYNGTTVIAIARINADGSLDTGYNLGGVGMNNAVSTITLQPDGKALVGGLFTSYNTIARNRILRLNADGSLDSGFNPGTGAGGGGADVLAIALQSNGQVLVGGTFTTMDGNTRNRIARLNADGSLDAAWTNGANNALNTILWIPEGRAIIGGLFTSYASAPRNRVLRLNAQCTDDTELTIVTDANGSETGWEIIPQGYSYAAYSGSGLPSNSTITENACLADGCYTLRVTDSGGDGILDGGYVLRSQSTDRIIDDEGNFTTGSVSQISGSQGGPTVFCIPIGGQRPIYTSRDKLDWVVGQYVVAEADAAVSQVWNDYGPGSAERASTGYDFWFFNPNGGYTFRRSRRHSTSDGFAPASATRACHMKINNWAAANHIPAFTLMNVRVRPVVLGVPGDWGPAYRFKIDPVRAACPLTKLMDIPGNPYLSCGQYRDWGGGNFIHARPVSGANKYQFRFRLLDNTLYTVRTSNTYFLQLNWGPSPLVPGTTYKVDVRASFDGGATWCSDLPTPLDPWGDVCLLTINSSFAALAAGSVAPADEGAAGDEPVALTLWPNPLRSGEALNLAVAGARQGLPLDLEVVDATGRRAHAQTLLMGEGAWQGAVLLDGLAPGSYVLRAATGDRQWTERLLVID
ncbi:MAG: delta-60 repeat domain-containing protein, partial [Flavobacteriales bacterium]